MACKKGQQQSHDDGWQQKQAAEDGRRSRRKMVEWAENNSLGKDRIFNNQQEWGEGS